MRRPRGDWPLGLDDSVCCSPHPRHCKVSPSSRRGGVVVERGDGGLFVAGAGAPAGVGSGVLRLLSRASRRTAGHATSPVLRRSRAAASAAYRASLCTGELGAVSRYIATSPHTEASLLKNNGQITARNGHFGPMHMILRQSTMPIIWDFFILLLLFHKFLAMLSLARAVLFPGCRV